MIKRSEMEDPRMKYTAKEIALYNAEAYNNFVNGMMICVSRKNDWVPPDIKDVKDE